MASRVYVGVGDSISSQELASGDGYPTRYAATAIPSVDFTLRALSGQGLVYFQGSASVIDAAYSASKPSIMSLLQGNDNSNEYADFGGSQATFLAALAAFLDARRAVGFKVILCTPLPRTGFFAGTNYNIKRAQERAAMLTWVGTHCDYLCDMGADPTMGPDAAASNAALYYDGTHPTALGSTNLAAILATIADRVGVRHRVTWTTPVAVSGAPLNGGRSQTNLNTLNNGEFPFMNVLKHAGNWDVEFSAGNNETWAPDLLDANGYPMVMFANGAKTQFKVPTTTQRPGNYILTWDGTGTVGIGGGGDILTGTASFTGSISGTTLTIPGTVTGTIKFGQRLNGGTILPYTFIMSQLTSTTYKVNKIQTVASVAMTTDNGSKSSTGSAGAGFFVASPPTDPSDANIIFHIQAFGTPWVTNVKIYHVDDADDIAAGKMFGKKFIARLKEANFGVIRFLNWQSGNTSCVTTWATRKPVGYAFYSGAQYRADLYCQSLATRSGPAYTVTPPAGFVLADKATIQLKWQDSMTGTVVSFTNASTSIAMPAHGLSVGSRLHLSLDSGGTLPGGFAVSTRYYVVSVPDSGHITLSASSGGAAIAASGVGSQPGQPATANPFITLNTGTGPVDMLADYANWFQGSLYPIGNSYVSLNTLVYDATLQAWIRFGMGGGGGPTFIGIDNGVPVEVCIQLCAEVGAHPYFVTPHLACDPMTDFVPSLAQYCKDNCPDWMIPRFEGPNELWNTSGGFFQTGFAVAKANAYNAADPTHWTQGDFNNWYGKIISTIGQSVSTVYAGDRSKYQVVGGVQTVKMGSSGERAESAARFTSPSYVGQTAAAQSPYTKTAASTWVTHLCCAQYFNPGLMYTNSSHGTPNEADLAVTYAGGGGAAATALTTYTASCAGPAPSYAVIDYTIAKELIFYQGAKTLAQSVGIQKICGYEGGYSPDYGGGTAIDNLRRAGKDDPQMYTFTLQNLNNFAGQTGGGFVAEFPSNFIIGSNYTWSILDPDIYVTNTQQWNAHIAFNH